jgi:aconitate hydratase 2/2-methylisocitrate dehydratase
MDQKQLTEEGHYGVFGTAGARMEMPGCSLCMGNQAQVREGATVMSTSTRNFPNRLGKNTNVYLARPNWPRSARAWAASRPRKSTWPTSA